MSKYVTRESGELGLDFGQLYQGLFPDELDNQIPPEAIFPVEAPLIIAQALLANPDRRRALTTPVTQTIENPSPDHLFHRRQSRITAGLKEIDISFSPHKPKHPDAPVIFSREDIYPSPEAKSAGPKLETAAKRKTTISLSGMSPLFPTHRIFFHLSGQTDPAVVNLKPEIPKFKLNTLTTGDGGLAYKASVEHYQTMLAQRLAAEIGTNPLAAETEPLTEKAGNSEDLLPEIPW